MKRPVQYFTPEYLEKCKQMTPEEILTFLDEFRILFGESEGRRRLEEQERLRAEWLQKWRPPPSSAGRCGGLE